MGIRFTALVVGYLSCCAVCAIQGMVLFATGRKRKAVSTAMSGIPGTSKNRKEEKKADHNDVRQTFGPDTA